MMAINFGYYNCAEVIPGVIRPLTWSINRPLTCGVWGEIFTLVLGKGSEDLDFQETATLHYQRAYFNATLLGTIFRRMGLPPESLEFLTRGAKFTKPSLITTIKNLPNLLRLARREWTLEKDFSRDNQSYFSPLLQELKGQDLSPLSASDLLQGIENILKVLKKATYYSILCPLSLAIRQGLSKVSLEELDNSLAPEVASVRSLQYLATEARNILNPELIEEKNALSLLAEIPTGQAVLQGFNEWLETYGYLSDAATDIAVPRWREDPTSVQELFNQFFAREQKSINPKHSRFKNLQKRLDLKNTSTTIYSQLLAHLRWHFVALEKRLISTNILRETGDIFFLTYPEIVELVTSKDLSVDILSRRQEFRQNQQIESVPRVIYGNSPYLESYVVSQSSEKKLQGIGASSGQVEGRIKVLKNLQQIDKIEENTILVVPYTDSGWAPWLCQAVGIISEVGGSLSHGAIVAREYGIPAVMDIHNATNILRNGQRVRIDGQRGIVEII
jgi:pyruvate,water dikinase